MLCMGNIIKAIVEAVIAASVILNSVNNYDLT